MSVHSNSSNLERPAHHKDTSEGFQNPWRPLTSFSQMVLTALKLPVIRITPYDDDEEVREVKVVEPDWNLCEREAVGGNICATWLGHAGYLVHLPSKGGPVTILFDPIFAERASPSSYFGPRRRLPPPCTIEDLPEVDYVVLSHNHYDHMDGDALQRIWKKAQDAGGRSPSFLVPLGVKEVLAELGLPDATIYEMDWWSTTSFPLQGVTDDGYQIEFLCVPAQHNSGRGVLDQNATLWSSWVVRTVQQDSTSPEPSVYFAGDTGYQTADGPCPAFKEIGDKYGPFDLAMIPIWRGASLSFLGRFGLRLSDDTLLSTLHALPEDAVLLASDVRARHSLAMHFGTFAGSKDEALEPIVRLKKARRGDWRDEGGFGWVDVGETAVIPVGKGL